MVAEPRRGEIWWADLGEPIGSEPGYRRPVLIVHDNHFNRSNLATVLILSLTSNLRYQDFPGNVYLAQSESGLGKDSVINVTQLAAIDRSWLEQRVSDLPRSIMAQVDHGLKLVLGLPV